jgi:hypothetical protein
MARCALGTQGLANLSLMAVRGARERGDRDAVARHLARALTTVRDTAERYVLARGLRA